MTFSKKIYQVTDKRQMSRIYITFYSKNIIENFCKQYQTTHKGTCTNAKNLYLYNDPVLSNDIYHSLLSKN